MIFKAIKVFLNAILIFLAVLLLMIVVQASWAFIGRAITQNLASAEQLFVEQMYPITLACILTLWAKKKRKSLYTNILKAVHFNKNNILIFTKTVFFVLSALYIPFIISGLLNQYEFIHLGISEYSLLTILKQILLVGIFANILVAVGEEIIFRGFLMNYIIDLSKSKLFALLFTSFVFSLHPYMDFLNYVIAFLGGLTMGYAYLKYKTLYVPMGIHFAYNLFNFTIASEPGRGPQLPYIVKFDYLMILDGLGAWVDLFIILGFLSIFFFLWFKQPSREKVLENLV